MRQWARLGALLVAAVVVAQLLVQNAAPPLAAGGEAPPLALRDLEGRLVDLQALRGRVVAVNFWATWCAPCLAELPDLAAAWRERPPCLELLGVAEESALDDVRRVARAIPYPVLLDERAEAAAAWKVGGYPTTWIVDAEGRVARRFAGPVRRAELEAAVRPLLPTACEGG